MSEEGNKEVKLSVTFALLVLAAAILAHALIPRYEIRTPDKYELFRVDRWTGHIESATPDSTWIKRESKQR